VTENTGQREEVRIMRQLENPIEVGKPYQIAIETLNDQWRITINGQLVELPGINIPWKEFRVYLRGWQPTNTWRVRNVTVK
jgi:hypothetical protein